MRIPLPLARAIPLLALALSLAACQDASFSEADYAVEDAQEVLEAEALADPARGPDAVPVVAVQDTSARRRAPILIRRADLRLRVGSYERASGAVPEIVERFDAYLAGEEASQSDTRVTGTFTIRVAAAQFDSLLAELVDLASVVEGRSVIVDDVTEEYVDVEGRLRARRAVEAQYVALLARASDVEEVLQVQQALAQVREEIESAEGRLRFLSDRAAMSTITLTLFEQSAAGLSTGPGFFRRAGDAVGDGWRALVDVLVALVALWPVWIAIALGVLLLRRWRRRHPDAFRLSTPEPRRRRASVPPPDRGPQQAPASGE